MKNTYENVPTNFVQDCSIALSKYTCKIAVVKTGQNEREKLWKTFRRENDLSGNQTSVTIIAKHHGQSIQSRLVRIDVTLFGLIQLTHYHRKHHSQSVQRHLDRIDTMQFGSIQLTNYHHKASSSISSTSP